jgi:transposase-like protein
LKKRRGTLGDTWQLDEVFLKLNGKTHSLGLAGDQEGNVLDILVQSRRELRTQPNASSASCSKDSPLSHT